MFLLQTERQNTNSSTDFVWLLYGQQASACMLETVCVSSKHGRLVFVYLNCIVAFHFWPQLPFRNVFFLSTWCLHFIFFWAKQNYDNSCICDKIVFSIKYFSFWFISHNVCCHKKNTLPCRICFIPVKCYCADVSRTSSKNRTWNLHYGGAGCISLFVTDFYQGSTSYSSFRCLHNADTSKRRNCPYCKIYSTNLRRWHQTIAPKSRSEYWQVRWPKVVFVGLRYFM